MKVLRQVIGKPVVFGGDESIGWLPPNAATPMATPIENTSVDVRILETDGAFIVEWRYQNTTYSNDSWHATIEEAQEYARDQFGIEGSDWEVTS